ncbi:uncharacterized protein METZ01_LOCUS104624 [marine metagenome]|uniref:Uncharacterized protein n=1 Tax=marine metagenome TaxID=408172 RepID=A0A381WGX2_9ZZZZ
MQPRIRSVAATVIGLTCALTLPFTVAAQVERVADPSWSTPRTADGQPDLQGLWGNKTITPTERPDSAEGRAFLTDEEMAAANQRRVQSLRAQDAAPAQRTSAGGQLGAYGSYWLDSGDTVLSTGQTSLIVDPPDGRAPIKSWASEAKAYGLAHEGEDYRYLSTLDRCLSRGVPGSMLPAGYNNTHRIVQTPDHVVLQHEMIHDLRIIPLSGHSHIDPRIGLWMGDARAHWEDEVLVVETRNFHNRGWLATSGAGRRLKGIPTSKAMHVTERYERVSESTIMWTVTVEDPNVYTRPWTISIPLTAEPDYVIYEYACHEGNYAIPNILAGARMEEARAAQAAAEGPR